MAIYKKVTIFQGGGGSDDKKAKVSIDDTQAAFLEDKIIAASNKVDVSVFNPGGIEQLEIDINESNIDHDALLNFDAAEHAPLNDLSTTSSSLWSSQKTQDELDTKVNKAGDTMTGILLMDNTYVRVIDADGDVILHPDYLDVYNQAGDRGATISKTQSYFGYYTGSINPYIEMNYDATTANIKIYDLVTNDPILPVNPEDVVVKQYADTKVAKVSSTDNAITRFDGTSGNVQNSGVSIDDANNITGVNDLTVSGNLTVNGTTTTVNTINTDITDANITLNKGGDQASADAQDSGITVEMSDATDAIIGYDSTLASKFKIGEVGAEYEIASTGHTQTLTNKTVDADNNTISNLETDNLKAGVLNTSTSLTGATDTQIASALAIQTYVQNAIDEVENYAPNKTLYVDDVKGSDLNQGSIHKPFKTIQAAINAATQQASFIHVNNGVYNEDLVLAGKYNLIISTDGNTDSPLTYIIGTINLVDSESVRFRNFGIQKNTVDPIIKFGQVSPVAPVSGSGRHYFESCTIANLSGGTVVEVGEGITEFVVFRSCAFTGHINMSNITSTGSSVSLLSCTSEGSSITVGTNQTLLAAQCLSVGPITHTNGVVYLKDVDILQKNQTGDSLLSSASFSPSNFIFIEDVNLYDASTQSYGKLTIPQTAFILNLASRGSADVLNEAFRVTRGQKSKDIHYDNTISGLTATNVQDAITEIEAELDSAASNKADRNLSNLIAGTSAINIETSEDISINATGVSKNINLSATQAVNVTSTLWVTNSLQFTDNAPASISTFDGFDSVGKPSSESININSGNVTDGASSGDSGDLVFKTGDNSGSGDTGSINIQTGSPNTGNSGSINLNAPIDKSLLQNHPSGSVANAIATVQFVQNSVGASGGDINETTFSGSSGAVSANVTGLSFSNASIRSFEAQVSVAVDADSDLFEEFEISGIQRGSDWQIIVESVGDDTNVDFNIDNSGQIIYSSPAYTGFNSMDVRFRAKVTGA